MEYVISDRYSENVIVLNGAKHGIWTVGNPHQQMDLLDRESSVIG